MTAPIPESQSQEKPNDKELNFRALEAKTIQAERRAQEAERRALEAEKMAQEAISRKQASPQDEDDDEDDQAYVDHKRLNKQLNKFGQNTKSEIQKAMEEAKRTAKEEVKREVWLEQNPDFYDTLKHADKLLEKAPKLAEAILRMPESFERQQLVYNNIKALGVDKPEVKQPSIQEKIDANRKSPYYQPSGISPAPYAAAGDFSASGQKNAYAKMQELKNKLRI
jgi:hypothetical protein